MAYACVFAPRGAKRETLTAIATSASDAPGLVRVPSHRPLSARGLRLRHVERLSRPAASEPRVERRGSGPAHRRGPPRTSLEATSEPRPLRDPGAEARLLRGRV